MNDIQFMQESNLRQQRLGAEAVPQPDTNGEFNSPLDGALFMASMGIPQTPLQGKKPSLSEWPSKASCDPEQIKRWAEQHVGCNFGSVARCGEFFIFEADSLDVRKRMKDTGHDFTSSFIVESSPGRGHRYYRWVEGVENIGQDASTLHGDFSVRVDNEQCVSPGSVNPKTDKQYRLIQHDDISVPSVHEIAFWNSEKASESKTDESDTWMDEPIPDGKRNSTLTAIGGNLRRIGLDEESIYATLSVKNQNQCNPPLHDNEVHTIARSVARYKPEETTLLLHGVAINGVDAVKVQADKIQQKMDEVEQWRQQFRSVAEMEQGEPVMVIEGVLQEGTCFIAAVPGECKTLLALSMAKSISDGTPFLGLEQFRVPEARSVVYLIPESRDRAFRKRCEAFRITHDKTKFMARTLSSGLPLELGDPYLLEAVKALKPIVFLDTATRFMKSTDENSAAQNRELFNDVSKLLVAGAVTVVLVHHATKASKKEKMTQENMLRGSSDLAAMCDQSYGIQRDNVLYEYGAGPLEINLVSLKDREQTGALTTIRLAATVKESKLAVPVSCINKTGNFVVVNPEEMQKKTSESVVRLVELDPNRPAKDMAAALGMTEYGVKKELRDAGWHSVQGGKDGASPWHKDNGQPCPYAKETRSRVKAIKVDLEQPKSPVN